MIFDVPVKHRPGSNNGPGVSGSQLATESFMLQASGSKWLASIFLVIGCHWCLCSSLLIYQSLEFSIVLFILRCFIWKAPSHLPTTSCQMFPALAPLGFPPQVSEVSLSTTPGFLIACQVAEARDSFQSKWNPSG